MEPHEACERGVCSQTKCWNWFALHNDQSCFLLQLRSLSGQKRSSLQSRPRPQICCLWPGYFLLMIDKICAT